jgi:HSP20 family protein
VVADYPIEAFIRRTIMANMTVPTTRWNPAQEMMTLREVMNQMFDDSITHSGTARRARSFMPALDLSETTDAYQIELAVPGLKAEDLEIAIEQGQLTIKGEVKQQKEEQKRNYHRVERQYGAFARTISLPATVRADAISADLQDGVLSIAVPKAELVKPRKVAINVSGSNAEPANN